jgi:cell division protein FtsB
MSSAKSKPAPKLTHPIHAAGTWFFGQRRKAATAAAAALALLMGYHVVFGQNGLTAYEHKRQDAHDLQQQMQALQSENDRLRGHVDRLQNDPGAIEHQAREELHYTRAGEVIYTLPADPTPAQAKTAVARR